MELESSGVHGDMICTGLNWNPTSTDDSSCSLCETLRTISMAVTTVVPLVAFSASRYHTLSHVVFRW